MRASPDRIIIAATLALLAAAPAPSHAQTAIASTVPRPAPAADEVPLAITPMPAPVPALKYRLLPTVTQLNPGDAAPIYLRLGYGLPEGEPTASHKQVDAWLALPLDQLPAAEVAALLDRWAPQLHQVEFAAHRQACDWSYTIAEERDDPFNLRMADAQAMRFWGALIALKARAETKAGRFDAAVGTIRTGMALGRHVAAGPYYINVMCGQAIISRMAERLVELVGRPGAPNLYWALTALPRPLVDFRAATARERQSIERVMDEIEADPPTADAGWAAALDRLHAQLVRFNGSLGEQLAAARVTADPAAFRASLLPKARAFLKARGIEAAGDDRAMVLAIIADYRAIADDFFKYADTPYPDAAAARGDRLSHEAKAGPAGPYTLFLPAYEAVHLGVARGERLIAELRVIEALRLHAAAHGGQLPDALDQLKVVPIPANPMTGRPFDYRRDGAAALLTGPTDPPIRKWNLYRIAVRP